jgi:tetratricopeptide (TPR) repeat protein
VPPDTAAIEEIARQAGAVALHRLEASRHSDQARLRAIEAEEAALASALSQDVRRRLDETRAEAAVAQAGASYERGTMLLDRGKLDEAVAAFDAIIKAGGSKAEGAHYWKAYAQNRLGQRTEALATHDAMLKAYPSGRWANDARALQVEVRQASGQPVNPNQATDNEIKLIALNSIVRSQPEQAVSIIETMLAGPSSPRIKERALLVLSQAPVPRARTLLLEIAKGKGNPDLQLRAIDNFGTFTASDPNTIKQMVEIYRAVSDIDVKKRVIRSLASQGRVGFLYRGVGGGLEAAHLPDLGPVSTPVVVSRDTGLAGNWAEAQAQFKAQMDDRAKAREARAAEAREALWQIFQSESSVELKKEILRSSALVADQARLISVVKSEKNADLRQVGIRSLGTSKDPKLTDLLLAFYREEKDTETRRSVIDALFTQQNAAALVQLARQETDPELRRAIVQHLSGMKAKEATDYMLEILKK